MKKLFSLTFIFFVTTFGFCQVSDLYTVSASDFNIVSKQQYTVVENKQSNTYTYYMNSGISNNYVLDVNSTETTINFSNYPTGFYNVVLITNGVISETKIIYKPSGQ